MVATAVTAAVVLGSAAPAQAQKLNPDTVDFGTEWPESFESVCAPSEITGEPLSEVPWHLSNTDMEAVHAQNRGTKADGDPVKVAVIDSGANDEHPTYKDRIRDGLDPWDPKKKGRCDAVGHGSEIAGLIAGGHDPESSYIGIAPEVLIYPMRMYPENYEGADTEISKTLAAMINTAINEDMDVINISLTTLPHASLERAIERAWDEGVIVVAAVGNNTLPMDEMEGEEATVYPAQYEKALAVTAYNERGWWTGSNFGSRVDVMAPGDQIWVPTPKGNGYKKVKGTSFAAPIVAGLVSLITGKYGSEIGTGNADWSQWVHDRVKATATPAPGGYEDCSGCGHNAFQGNGAVNMVRALTAEVTTSGFDEDRENGETSMVLEEKPPVDQLPTVSDEWADKRPIVYGSMIGVVLFLAVGWAMVKVIPNGRRRGWKPQEN